MCVCMCVCVPCVDADRCVSRCVLMACLQVTIARVHRQHQLRTRVPLVHIIACVSVCACGCLRVCVYVCFHIAHTTQALGVLREPAQLRAQAKLVYVVSVSCVY